jgi:membrane associated rhomboid family serine protease
MSSVFFHGGWSHLLGNMLYLFLFGDNVEDRLGWIFYPVLYFGSGSAAARAQIAIDPTSTIVLVGGSSAIASVLGSYFLFLPAWIVIGLWLLMQIFNGVTSLGVATRSGVLVFLLISAALCSGCS